MRSDGKVYDRRTFARGYLYERWITPEQLDKLRRTNADRTGRHRIANPEKTRSKLKIWREKRAGIVKHYKACKRAEKYGSFEHGNAELISHYYLAAKRITKCTGLKWSVDHVIPLCKGGKHVESNLALMPWISNIRKGRRLL